MDIHHHGGDEKRDVDENDDDDKNDPGKTNRTRSSGSSSSGAAASSSPSPAVPSSISSTADAAAGGDTGGAKQGEVVGNDGLGYEEDEGDDGDDEEEEDQKDSPPPPRSSSSNTLIVLGHRHHYQRDDERVVLPTTTTTTTTSQQPIIIINAGGGFQQQEVEEGRMAVVTTRGGEVVDQYLRNNNNRNRDNTDGTIARGGRRDDQTRTSSSTTAAAAAANSFLAVNHHQRRDEPIILPAHWTPGNKDVLCGRARDYFHHEGNKFFRKLIQKNIGPYLGSANKVEKGEVIVRIVQLINDASPMGGFVRKDETTGRWCKIKDGEARDKVGHAVRKAVQRLEDTKPRLAARLKLEHSSSNKSPVSSSSSLLTKKSRTDNAVDVSKSIEKIKSPSPSTSTRSSSQFQAYDSASSSLSGLASSNKTSDQEATTPVTSQLSKSYMSMSATNVAGVNSLSVSAGGMDQRLSVEAFIRGPAASNSINYSDLLLAEIELERRRNRFALTAALASQLSGTGSALPSTVGMATSAFAADQPKISSVVSSSLATRGHAIDASSSFLRGSISSQPTLPIVPEANIPATLASPYELIVRLQQQQQSRGMSMDDMQLLRALQRQEEEAKFVRERIGQSSNLLAMNPTAGLSGLLGGSSAAPVPSLLTSIGSSIPTMASSNLNNAMASIGGQGLSNRNVSPALLHHLLLTRPGAVATTRGRSPSGVERLGDILRRAETDRNAESGMKSPPSK